MDALALLEKYRDRKTTVFPASEKVPLAGVVSDHWQELVHDDQHEGAINRISYEWCVLTALREKVRCKEVWVKDAHRFRNPDEDLPQDFDSRRDEYYAALEQPRDAGAFVEHLRSKMEAALTALDLGLPANVKVKIVTTKNGKGRIRLTPLEEQPEPANIVALTAALVHRWPMTNLLDILKETELRVRFTEAFRTIGTREVLSADVLRRRLLLCLYGLGTNAGLKRMCSGGGEDSYPSCSTSGGVTSPKNSCERRSRDYATPFSERVIRLCGARAPLPAHRTRRSSGLGPEFDDRVARALRRAGRDDLLARGEELGVHLLAAEGVLVVRGRCDD
jgi:hypothetical protein